MVDALIMAGGKGTRLNIDYEKPLIQVKGRPLIDFIFKNLEGSKKIKRIMVVTSPHTPKTEAYVKKRGYDVIHASGKGYIKDLQEVLSHLEKGDKRTLLIINADLPLVNSSLIDKIIKYYENSQKPALAVFVPIRVYREYGLKPSILWKGLVPSGVNILKSENRIQEQEILEVPRLEFALNIDTLEDLKFLEKLLGS